MGVRKMMLEHQFVDFVTITSHERLRNFAQTETVWRSAWPEIYNVLKRRNPALEYMLIPERHKDGRMHVHAIWNAGQGRKQLKKIVRSRGLGYMLDVSHIAEPHNAVWYVTKYVSKDLGADVPAKFHRVRVSQNWPRIAKPDNDAARMKWEYITTPRALEVIYSECEEKHIDLIDIKTGSNFEDVGVEWCGVDDIYA